MDDVETAVSEAVVAKLRGTLGAYEAGVLITLFLFGITTVQAYTFLRSVRKLVDLPVGVGLLTLKIAEVIRKANLCF